MPKALYQLSEAETEIRERATQEGWSARRLSSALYRYRHPQARREALKKWKAKNIDRVREHGRKANGKYRAANKAKIYDINRKWQEANPDTVKANRKKYYAANKEQLLTKNKAWQKANRTRVNRVKREWYAKNPTLALARTHRRRARSLGNGGSYTNQEFLDLCVQFSNRCLCCKRDAVRLTPDHVIPLALGGRNDIGNIQPLCLKCNQEKHTRIVDFRHTSDA